MLNLREMTMNKKRRYREDCYRDPTQNPKKVFNRRGLQATRGDYGTFLSVEKRSYSY